MVWLQALRILMIFQVQYAVLSGLTDEQVRQLLIDELKKDAVVES